MVSYCVNPLIQVIFGGCIQRLIKVSAMEWLAIPRSSVKLYVGGKQEVEVYLKYPVIGEVTENCTW
jgi:hypothetical protein